MHRRGNEENLPPVSLGDHCLEPGERWERPPAALLRACRVGGELWPLRRAWTTVELLQRLFQIVRALGGPSEVAVGRQTRRTAGEGGAEPAAGDLYRALVVHVEEVVPRIVVVHPFREAAEGDAFR